MVARKKRVLIIDDKGSSARIVCLSLEKIDPSALLRMSDAVQMLAFARVFGPDVLLLDAELPGVDGPTVWARFRDDPAYGELPILFLTRTVPGESPARWETDDNTFTLIKPLTLPKLGACVARLLGVLCDRRLELEESTIAA